MSGIEQAREGSVSLRRHARALAALAALLVVVPVAAQAPAPGWVLIVRIVPNPMPIGRCGGVTVEVQDDEGYRRNELSNGGVIDFHKFRYDVDTTNFQWQNGNPVDAVLCTRAGAPPSSVTVTVTLPDGLSGSAQLTSLAAGQTAAAVQYAKQGPLKRPGVPPPHASTVAAASTAPTAGSAPAGTSASPGGATAAPTRSAAGTPSRMSSSASSRPLQVTTSALGMTGAYFAGAMMSVTTPALSMTGSYFAGASTEVTTSALAMTGSYFTSGGVSVTTSALTMTGTSSTRASRPGTTPTRVPY